MPQNAGAAPAEAPKSRRGGKRPGAASRIVLPRTARIAMDAAASASAAAAAPAASLHVEARLTELGLRLPAAAKPVASYVMCTRVGNLLYLAGHLPQPAEGPLMVGKVGKDVTTEQGAEAAKAVALNIIATLKSELGDLDKVKRIVKLTGFVNCVDGFSAQPKVVNGASDLFVQVFGAKGSHSRSAVGTNALPLNVPVEIEAIVEVE